MSVGLLILSDFADCEQKGFESTDEPPSTLTDSGPFFVYTLTGRTMFSVPPEGHEFEKWGI